MDIISPKIHSYYQMHQPKRPRFAQPNADFTPLDLCVTRDVIMHVTCAHLVYSQSGLFWALGEKEGLLRVKRERERPVRQC